MDLKEITTKELIEELNARKNNEVIKIVDILVESIQKLNGFGIQVEHETENIRLLPHFIIDRYQDDTIRRIIFTEEDSY